MIQCKKCGQWLAVTVEAFEGAPGEEFGYYERAEGSECHCPLSQEELAAAYWRGLDAQAEDDADRSGAHNY